MKLNDAIAKIEKYLASSSGTPMIVDLQTKTDYDTIKTYFSVGENVFMAAAQYCNDDECPRYDDLYHALAIDRGNVFLTGLSAFLRLLGEQAMKQHFRSLLGMSIVGHVVVITFGCSQFLQFADQRIRQTKRVITVEGTLPTLPNIIFSNSPLSFGEGVKAFMGIHELESAAEFGNWDTVILITAKKVSLYPLSMYNLEEISSAYDILCSKDHSTSSISKDMGTDEQWKYALSLFETQSSWSSVISQEFGSTGSLAFLISSYRNFDANKKWLYYLGLQLFGAKGNLYLSDVIKNCTKYSDFSRMIFRQILAYSHTGANYQTLYQQRRLLLPIFSEQHSVVIDYCKVAQSKGKDTIFYLSDSTQPEKELIFAQLEKYGMELGEDRIKSILKTVYPDLAVYLSDYSYHIPLLDQYFKQYKLCKVTNTITDEFASVVQDQAIKREFNSLLQPRYSKTEQIAKNGAVLYFIDALGVEYLAFIVQKCMENELRTKVDLATCELPSITGFNKEFVETFEAAGCKHADIKKLDEIKHHGNDSFNYETTKLPIHMIWELNILEETILKIKAQLASGLYAKAVIMSDHGASRLAVIREQESRWEMGTNGVHSGRCCPISEIDQKPDFATESNGFWCLANYDRFRGSRKANIEVHGGATLEEVVVPIIEITLKGDSIEVFIQKEFEEIQVSYRKKAAIELFIGAILNNVTVTVNGKSYPAFQTANDFIYRIDMPDIKKVGPYKVDVFENGNKIAEDLTFTVKKEGSSERNLL